MLFSRDNRGDIGFALLGCLYIAIVLGLLITFGGSFSLGWFTPAAGWLLLQSVVGVFVLCFVLALAGLTDFMTMIGLLPMLMASGMLAEEE